jgi:hypothetical protein
MATVRSVSLQVADRADAHGRWQLDVSFSLAFEKWERDTWFQETVEIVGIAEGGDRVLARMVGPAYQASTAMAKDALVAERKAPSFVLDHKLLDVNRDVELVGSASRVVVLRSDRIYAEVSVAPLKPSPGDCRSSVQKRQFGVVE